MVSTWEEAAAAAAGQVSDMVGHGDDRCKVDGNELHSIEVALKNLRDGTVTDAWVWAHIGCEAMVASDGDIAKVVETIISKQHDYGHENILWAGVDGLIVRIHDKVARIKNLQRRMETISTSSSGLPGVQVASDPLNESLADSWLDIVGYSIIGIMLIEGTFELPLAADVPVGNPFTFSEWQKNNSLANDDTIARSVWVPYTQEFVDDWAAGGPDLSDVDFEAALDAAEDAAFEDEVRKIAIGVLEEGHFELDDEDEAKIKGWINEALAFHSYLWHSGRVF